MRNVALDLGAKKIVYCEVADGEVVERLTVTSLSSLESRLGPKCEPARVAIEACREAWHTCNVLEEWGNVPMLVDTTRSRQLGIGQHGRKNDHIDAEVLAKALARGSIPAAHVLSPERRELRRALGVRRALVETRAQYITTIRGLARELGASLPKASVDSFVKRLREATLDPKLQTTIEPLLVTLEVLQVELDKVEQRLEESTAQEPIIRLLMTAPGVGVVVATSFVSVIDDASRFQKSHQVQSYLGLVPSENSSGGKRRLGAISKKGNTYLRSLLVQAAWSLLRSADRADPIRQWTEVVARRRGKRVAIVALARRLAGVLWAMWRDGTAYDAALAAKKGARGLRIAAQSIEQRAEALEKSARKIQQRRSHRQASTMKKPQPSRTPTTEVTA